MRACYRTRRRISFPKRFGCLMSATPPTPGGIDLTPHFGVRRAGGKESPQLEFREGHQRILYEPPPRWQTFPRTAGKVMLVPVDNSQAHATIEFLRLKLPAFDEVGVALLKQHMLALTPAQAQERRVGEAEVNRVVLNGHATCELVAAFVEFGHSFKLSVLFVDLGDSQLRFTLLCRGSAFADLHPAFRASIATWRWLPATGDSENASAPQHDGQTSSR